MGSDLEALDGIVAHGGGGAPSILSICYLHHSTWYSVSNHLLKLAHAAPTVTNGPRRVSGTTTMNILVNAHDFSSHEHLNLFTIVN